MSASAPSTGSTPAALVDLILPRACAGCARAGWSVCPVCRSRFGPARPHTPAPAPQGWPATFVSATYADDVRSILLAYKEHGRGELAGPLSVALAGAVAATLSTPAEAHPARRPAQPTRWVPPALVVPVPTRRAAARARGGDHLPRLIRPAVRHLRERGYDVHHAPLLRLVGRPRDSTGLSAPARAANVRGRFRLAPGALRLLAGVRVVVVVDDVITTGATVAEATRTLRAAIRGRTFVRAAAVAATPRLAALPTSDGAGTITQRERG